VYCLEAVDNPAPLHTLQLPHSAPARVRFERDTVKLHIGGLAADTAEWNGRLYRSGQPPKLRHQPLVAVPYASWDNRSAGEMRVWIREAAWVPGA
jgi:uncharacterized protein